MDLKELVPPLDLCQKIPAGEFANSALYWAVQMGGTYPDVFPSECGNCDKFRIIAEDNAICPAPTLQEIMIEIDNLGGWCPTAYRLQNQWTVDYQEDRVDGMNDVVEQTDTDNPAAAALKLWLKLKGIE